MISSKGTIIWGTDTAGNGECALILENDGVFKIENYNGNVKWTSKTG